LVWWTLERRDKAITAFDELIGAFADMTDPNGAKVVTFALCQKALYLERQGDNAKAIALYDAVLQRSNGAPDSQLRERSAIASLHKADLLAKDGSGDEAVNTLEALIGQFDQWGDAGPPQFLGRALRRSAEILADADRHPEAIEMNDKLVALLERSSAPEDRQLVARALINRTVLLAMLGRASEATAGFERLINDFGEEALLELYEEANSLTDSDDPRAPGRLGAALQMRAAVLRELGREEEAQTVLATVIVRFENDPDPNIIALVQAARELRDCEPDAE